MNSLFCDLYSVTKKQSFENVFSAKSKILGITRFVLFLVQRQTVAVSLFSLFKGKWETAKKLEHVHFSKLVKLNGGGHRFDNSLATLNKDPGILKLPLHGTSSLLYLMTLKCTLSLSNKNM